MSELLFDFLVDLLAVELLEPPVLAESAEPFAYAFIYSL